MKVPAQLFVGASIYIFSITEYSETIKSATETHATTKATFISDLLIVEDASFTKNVIHVKATVIDIIHGNINNSN